MTLFIEKAPPWVGGINTWEPEIVRGIKPGFKYVSVNKVLDTTDFLT